MRKNRFSKIRIALDGPSGAGKSTIAKAVAKKAGIIYIDTGALYRSIGLYLYNNDIKPDDRDAIVPVLDSIDVSLEVIDGNQKVFLNGEDTGDRIRTPEISMYASACSKIPEVRAKLLSLQQNIAAKGGVIMDGRDIGTVVIPDAEVKVFMTATLETRARRRTKELLEKGMDVKYEDVYREMIERDEQDKKRDIAPCVPADDAVIFYNDEYNIEESADEVIRIAEEKIQGLD